MQITYKNWAFRFVIWIVIINIVTFYVTINYISPFYEQARVQKGLWLLNLLANLLLVCTILFLVMSMVRKEKKNYTFWIALGISALIVLSTMVTVISQLF